MIFADSRLDGLIRPGNRIVNATQMAQSTEKFKPIKVPAPVGRAFEQVASRIRQSIAAGQLKPGDKLAPERDMARQYEVGRNAVREALRDLESTGVVRLEKGRGGGAFVRPPNASRVTHALSDMVDGGSISLSDLTQARVKFMELVVRLASERITEADYAALEKNIEETEEFGKTGNFQLRADRIGQFYTLIAEATGNSVLVLMTTSLSAIVRRLLDQAVDTRSRFLPTTIASRRRFVRFLRAGEVDKAIEELSDHLARLHRSLSRRLLSESETKRGALLQTQPSRGKKRPRAAS